MESYSWPTPFEDSPWAKTPPFPKEIVHAVGAIAIAWNHCEEVHLDILLRLAGYRHVGEPNLRTGRRIFHPLGNRQRGETILALLDEVKPPEPFNGLVRAFRTHFDTCLTNRNLVVHALFLEETHGPLISNTKYSPKIVERHVPTDAAFWETTIAEIKRLYSFGADILDGEHDAWPEIPPAPRNLANILPSEVVDQLPPESSAV